MHESSVLESADTADTAVPTKHHVRRIIVSVVALVLLLMVGTGAAYLGFINHIVKTEVTHAALMPSPVAGEPVPTRDPVAGKALNILLVGSDSRTAVANGRSDVIVLIHITSDRKHAYLVHFPRDLYVDIPGHGKDKINAAYAYGGTQLLVRTVQNLVDVPLDNVAVIDFEGFKAMTVRSLDIAEQRWAIYWINGRDGIVSPPVHGGWNGDRGVFFGVDEDAGRPVRVRFLWERLGPDDARWSQDFALIGDQGAADGPWETNWIMTMRRLRE